jgi:hypothetical protein
MLLILPPAAQQVMPELWLITTQATAIFQSATGWQLFIICYRHCNRETIEQGKPNIWMLMFSSGCGQHTASFLRFQLTLSAAIEMSYNLLNMSYAAHNHRCDAN